MLKLTLRQSGYLVILFLCVGGSIASLILLTPVSLLNTTGVKSFCEKLVDVDGVLLGFSGIVFGVTFQRSEKKKSVNLVLNLSVTVGAYLGSILLCLIVLLVIDVASIPSTFLLFMPLAMLLLGTITMFNGIIEAYF